MFKSNRLQLAMLNLELAATFRQIVSVAWSLHVEGNYKTSVCDGRTNASKLYCQACNVCYSSNLRKVWDAIVFRRNCFAD